MSAFSFLRTGILITISKVIKIPVNNKTKAKECEGKGEEEKKKIDSELTRYVKRDESVVIEGVEESTGQELQLVVV